MKNKPLFERIVTISGDAIEKSANFMTRIGTPASFLIKQCGEVLPTLGQIIFGGPMMGTAAVNPDAPITKLTSALCGSLRQKTRKRLYSLRQMP